MTTLLRPAISLFVLLSAITGIVYPVAVTGIAQAVFPHAAAGSLITRPEILTRALLSGGTPEQNGFDRRCHAVFQCLGVILTQRCQSGFKTVIGHPTSLSKRLAEVRPAIWLSLPATTNWQIPDTSKPMAAEPGLFNPCG